MRNLLNTIQQAENKKVAIGHFNIANLEQLKAISNVAIQMDLPVIIGVSEGEREFIGVQRVRDIIDSYNREFGKDSSVEGFWLFLNADHTHSLEKAKEAVEAKFDAVIFDGSKLDKDENIIKTAEAVSTLKTIYPSICIEGELGYIGSGSEIHDALPEGAVIKEKDLTKPEEAVEFVQKTGVTFFSPAVGNVHGMFKNAPNPKLNIKRIKDIKDALKDAQGKSIPLVLHGGSGISDDDFVSAIDAGINIIHISTELRRAWREGMDKAFKENPNEVAPYKLSADAVTTMENVVENRLKLFNKF